MGLSTEERKVREAKGERIEDATTGDNEGGDCVLLSPPAEAVSLQPIYLQESPREGLKLPQEVYYVRQCYARRLKFAVFVGLMCLSRISEVFVKVPSARWLICGRRIVWFV